MAANTNEFFLARSGKRLAAFCIIGAGLFAAPLIAERVTFADATSMGAVARENGTTELTSVTSSRRIETAWELEARRSRDMAERITPPARLERIPPRIMLALR